mgnify:CR=1 FL=1|tara:strand:+ start:379 stop:654 length:276 start_codon:yes stop_codon:yes gene_type:complete
MAVGDIISAVAPGLTLNFVPAAGVEIIIMYSGTADIGFIGISDGVTTTQSLTQYSTGGLGTYIYKVGITNTNYLYVAATNSNCGYSGIQIK